MAEPSADIVWTSTFTHRCRDCLGTVQVIDFKPQPHPCEARTCDVAKCGNAAVGIIATASHHPDHLADAGTPGVTLLCDRHWSTPASHWDDEPAEG